MYVIKDDNDRYLLKDHNNVTDKNSYYYGTKADVKIINSYQTHSVKIIRVFFKKKAFELAKKYYGEVERGFFK